MSEHIWRIYRYYNPIEDKSYVGQTTKNVNERIRHGNGYSKGSKFKEAIDKYGIDTFEQSILRLCTNQEDADYWENFYIEKYNSIENGYNSKIGGCVYCIDHKWNDEQRNSISGENSVHYGKPRPEELRKRISEWMSGENNHCYGRVGEKHPNHGKSWYNNGIINVLININTTEVPIGFVKGKLSKSRNK